MIPELQLLQYLNESWPSMKFTIPKSSKKNYRISFSTRKTIKRGKGVRFIFWITFFFAVKTVAPIYKKKTNQTLQN
jgi:hypothetical protein